MDEKEVKVKRCPKGYRKDKNGVCVKYENVQTTQKNKEKCAKGTRRNRKTGICEPFPKPPKPVVENQPVADVADVADVAQAQEPAVEENQRELPVGDVADVTNVAQAQAQEQEQPELSVADVSEVADVANVSEVALQEEPDLDFLYPSLDDLEFQSKIASRQEFAETKYDGDVKSIQTQSDIMCNAKYELMPHQTFVKNFLSMQTPYNSLLLFHMLGTGKTCSAIGIAEEMRQYLQQMGVSKKIIVIASPNVQSNFRKELFDDRKLREINGIWTMDRTCIGNALLREINPTNSKGMDKKNIILQIDSIINQHYEFIGYGTFFNKMKKLKILHEGKIDPSKIRKFFNHQLVIVDEVHNIRVDETNSNDENKKVGALLHEIAKYSENMRLLLLSATPMYNSPTEIVWITNLLNAVDHKPAMKVKDVFDSAGNIRNEEARMLLRRKINGYVSFVRGENPYLFPFRVYPDVFDKDSMLGTAQYPLPTVQMNKRVITDPLRHVPVYMNPVGEYQKHVYAMILQNMIKKTYVLKNGVLKEKNNGIFENMETIGYTLLNSPIQSLNMVYPSNEFTVNEFTVNESKMAVSEEQIASMIGKGGLQRTMKFTQEETPPRKYQFEYKEKTRIFSPTEIGKYSAKIARICECIRRSTGIVLVYSQYIDGGIVPIALALEEMGLTRYATDENHRQNLFKKTKFKPEELDAITMKTRKQMGTDAIQFKPAKYMMITGDHYYSANKAADIKYATSPDNSRGEKVKVILISKAAAEGVDFKNIRQIHILDPWYNMNRIEQTIGRAVRTRSHCDLPFVERNVEIYLHATHLGTVAKEQPVQEEAADLYLYRVAEKKAVQIGKITRLLKQNAVDCVLNIAQTKFTADHLMEVAANEDVEQHLSTKDANGAPIIVRKFPVGDRPYTDICDYMETCELKCEAKLADTTSPIQETYSEDFLKTNSLVIMQKIRDLFADKFVFQRDELIASINLTKKYPIDHIYYALSRLVGNRAEEIVDHYGRVGFLVNKGSIYAFQPAELFDDNATVYERMNPVDVKLPAMRFDVRPEINEMGDKNKKGNKKGNETQESSESENQEPNQIRHSLIQSIGYVLDPRLHIAQGDKNWYKHVNFVYTVLSTSEIFPIPTKAIVDYSVFHFIDLLKIHEKIALFSEMHQIPKDLQESIVAYFQDKMIVDGEKKWLVLASGLKNAIYERTPGNQWTEVVSYTEITQLQPRIKSLLEINESRVYSKIGFMYPFKTQGVLFKIKNRAQEDKKNKQGAVCMSAQKDVIIQRINDAIGRPVYNKEMPFVVADYCVILELVLRHKTVASPEKKVYFFTPEQTLYNKITDT